MNFKKKILIRINTLRGGGAEKVLVNLLKYLDFTTYEVELLVNKKGYVHDKNINSHVKFNYLFKSSSLLSGNKIYGAFYKLIREVGLKLFNSFPKLLYKTNILSSYDIEFAFLEDMAPFIIESPNKLSKKIVWIHIDLLGLDSISNKKKRDICNALGRYDTIIVASNKVGDNLLELCASFNININGIRSKIKTIYYPIDVEEIEHKSKESIEEVKGTQPVLIAIATLSIQKRHDRLIKAHKKLLDNNILNTLWILGEGPMRTKIEALIIELNVQDSVKLLGFQQNPFPYLKKADIFVLSSDQEGFPLVLSEALVLEKPVVATAIAGTTEMLKNGEFGKLVEPSVIGLYEGLKDILTNKKNYKTAVENARKGKLQFNCKESVNEIEDLFDSK